MRIKTLYGVIGHDINLNEGEVVDIDDALGQRMVQRGLAEPFKDPEVRRVESRKAAASEPTGPTRTAASEPKARRGS